MTEFYIPNYHYENHELQVKVSDGDWSYDAAQQTLVVRHRPHAGEARHSLVIEIRDVKKHLLQRVLARREAGAPSFPFDLVSAETEAWFDEVDLGVEVLFILLAILMALLAIGVQVFRKA